MLYQVWFSENLYPIWTDEVRGQFSDIMENFFNLGNVVSINGVDRHLVRVMTSDIETGKAGLIVLGRNPIICGARDIEGNWHTDYPANEAEFDLYMQPVETLGVNGESITYTPADNTSAGWLSFKEIVVYTNPDVVMV
jgi:hypothetical protein